MDKYFLQEIDNYILFTETNNFICGKKEYIEEIQKLIGGNILGPKKVALISKL